MAPKPLIPPGLLRGPFTTEDARRAGLQHWHLRGKSWKRISRGIYAPQAIHADPLCRLEAATTRLPNGAVFSGLTAAWLHGIDVTPCDPIEVTVPPHAGVSSRAGIAIRRSAIPEMDVVRLRGLPATSVARTLADLAAHLSLAEAVVMADAALHARRVRLEQLRAWADANRHRRGIRRFRLVTDLAEPATESQMESRLRMVIVLGGLPRPSVQVPIYDQHGRLVGRPDLYYERQRLGIEYDGAVHRTSLPEDNRRQNLLLGAGVRLLRFTFGDVMQRPETVVAQVRAMLN